MNLRENEELIKVAIRLVQDDPYCREKTKYYAFLLKIHGIEIDSASEEELNILTERIVRNLISHGYCDEVLTKLHNFINQAKDTYGFTQIQDN